MAVDYATLSPGQRISEQTFRLDAETVASYIDAVDDRSMDWAPQGGDAFAPPMAIAAFGFRGLINDLEIPGGAIHGGQEIEFKGAVHVGETLKCAATILQNSIRRGMRFVVVRMEVEDGSGRQVLTGKSTIILPI